MSQRRSAVWGGLVLAATGMLAWPAATTALGASASTDAAAVAPLGAPSPWSDEVWSAARAENTDELIRLLQTVPESVDAGRVTGLRASIDSFLKNLDAQQARRNELVNETWTDLRGALEADEPTPLDFSNALREAVRLSTLTPTTGGGESIAEDPEIADLIRRGELAAERAEEERDWLTASEIYARLAMLLDDGLSYQADLDRLGARQALIRLYAPKTFYDLRNEHRVSRGGEELPPYNPRGEHYSEKLEGISESMVIQAIYRAVNQHVEPGSRDMAALVLAGLDGVRVFAETKELQETFPRMADESARREFLELVDRQIDRVSAPGYRATFRDLDAVLTRVTSAAARSLAVPEEAVVHEFGVGAMAHLDDFSDIIWPHDLTRFERQTRGRFVGVGIQIRLDEVSNIYVVTPLAGTPAQRAGVRAGDIIRKVDGDSTEGFSLEQAVDNITGLPNTDVVLTVEREIENDAGDLATVTEELTITRAEIDLPTVKGWEKQSPAEDDWSWLIDEANGIGYVRLTGFSDKTSRRLDGAIRKMEDQGARAVILDLRFNPGGLLNQAVEVTNRFVPEGEIVSTVDGRRSVQQRENAVASKARLSRLPVVVLVNENSASASEIVSGAIQHYADRGDIDAIVVGQRSFGKGSVQNVYPLAGNNAYMKLTTQYYRLPNGRILHRTPASSEWGVEPDFHQDLLPEQIAEMFSIRQNADVIPLDEFGEPIADLAPESPQKLLDEGIDLQLQTALVLLQARAYDEQTDSPVARQALGPAAGE